MDNLISVIIPVYNSQKYLKGCVDSIRNQTYRNLQIILVNDCSTDNSEELCKKFALEDSRIEVYKTDKNSGQSAARNLGIKHAKGSWIAFADNDDTMESEMLETLLKGALKHNVKVSGCGNKRFEDGNVEICNLQGRSNGKYKTDDIVRDIFINPNNTWIEVWTKIYHKSLIKFLNFPIGCQLEDYMVNLPLLYTVKEVYFCNKPMYNWNVNSNSQSKQKFFENRLSYMQISKEIVEWFEYIKASKEILGAAYLWQLGVQSSLLEQMCDSGEKKYVKLAKEYLPKVKPLYAKACMCPEFKLKTKIHVKLRFLKVKFWLQAK